jgi:signal transduction histidine kinase
VFTDVQPTPTMSPRRLLNYARVVFPIVVLACGLLMTAWIMRRELALTELQSTFVAAVTHEFKSPITSIRLLMERITSGRIASGDSPARYYAAIGAETKRLESLVNRLLESQKLQSGQREYVFRPTAIEALVRDAIERVRPQADARQIQIEVSAVGGIPPLALDADSVSDAIRNLLDNAIKYSPDHTRVSVGIDVGDGRVRLIVSDHGIGVDPADAGRIFEPFYRSRRGDQTNVHGTGLGLSLVRATAEAHGGSVTVSSDGERGSRFTLSFPLPEVTRAAATRIRALMEAEASSAPAVDTRNK